MVNINFTTGQKTIGLIITVMLVLAGVGTFMWSYDRDYSKLYSDGKIIAREKFSVEMNRVYSTIKYDYQKDNCLEIGGRLTDTRCYYPQNYYTKLNRNIKNTDITYTDNTDFYTINRNTVFYKYGTSGVNAGEIIQEYKHLKDVNDIKQFPVKYITTFTPNDNTKYRLIWEIDKLKDITLPDGKYTDCKYEFGKILIDLQNNCNDLEYAEIINSKNAIYFHFNPKNGEQNFELKLVDPPIINDTETFPHIFINESMVYVVTESGAMINITDSSTDVGVRTIGPKQYEWYYIYTYQGEPYHPKIRLQCNMAYTYDNGTYVCGDITVNMNTPNNIVNISDYNSTTVGTIIDQPEQILFNPVEFDNATGYFTYTLHSDYKEFRIGDKIVLDPTITINEVDAIDNSSYVNMRGEGATFSHLNLSDDSIILYMPFDDDTGSTTYDYSSNNNDGSISGATFTGDGYINNAYSFDGVNDYIKVDNFNDSYSNETFSFSVSFKTDGSSYARLFSTRSEGASAAVNGIDLFLRETAGYIHLQVGSNGNNIDAIGTDSLADGNLHNVIGVINYGEKLKLYVDGSEISYSTQENLSYEINKTTNALYIGSLPGQSYFNGTIDELMIFNRSLNQSEISAIYQNTSNRFVSQGTQTVRFQNISTGSDKVNVTLDDFRLNNGTIETRLNTWKPSMGYNDTDANLVAAWHLDGNALDATGRNNGTLSNGPISEDSIFGKQYNFDGIDDAINVSYDNSLNLSKTNEITFSSWTTVKSENSGFILSYGFNDVGAYEIEHYEGTFDDQVSCNIYNGSTFIKAYSGISYLLQPGELRFISCTFNGSLIKLYWDGELISTASFPYILGDSTRQQITIGARESGSFLNASIDEVRIYNRSLSAQEVKDLYVKGSLNYASTDWQNLSVNNQTYNYTSLDGAVACYINSEVDSCGTNNGTLEGNATWTDSGITIRSNVLELDGTGDYQDMQSLLTTLNSTNIKSLGCWIKTNLSTGNQFIFGAQNERLTLELDSNNKFRMSTYNGSTIRSLSVLDAPLNLWSHVFGSFNDTTQLLYINGELIDSDNSGTIAESTYFTIGRNKAFGDRYFNGMIDECISINRSLSATEIMDIYLGSKERHANNQFLTANDTTIIQSEYRVTPDSNRFLSPTVRFSQGLLYSLYTAEGLNVSLCSGLGGALNYSLNVTYYNPVTRVLYQTGINPNGYSNCNYTHNITNPGASGDLYAYLNATDDRFTIKVNNIAIGDTPVLIKSGFSNNTLTNETLDANISLTTANQSYSYNLNWVLS